MVAEAGSITFRLTGDVARIKRDLVQLRGSTRKLSLDFAGLAAAITGLFLGISLAIRSVVRDFAPFEAAISRAGNIAGATGDEFKALSTRALELAETTKFTGTQAAKGMIVMATAGQDAVTIWDSIPAVLKLAAAGNLEVARAADIVTSAMAGFNIEVKDLTATNDILIGAVTKSKVSVETLGEALKFVGPVANALGISLQDTVVAIGKLGDAGIPSGLAGRALRKVLVSLIKPSDQTAESIKKAGIAFRNAKGDIKNFAGIVKELESASGDAEKVFTQAFGTRAISAVLALRNSGSEAFNKLSREIDNLGGVTDKLTNAQMATLEGRMNSLAARVESAKISIGEGLEPILFKMIETAKEAASTMKAFGEELGAVFKRMSPEKQQAFADLAVKLSLFAASVPGLLLVGFALAKIAAMAVGIAKLSLALGSVLISPPILIFTAGMLVAITLIGKFKEELKALFATDFEGGTKDFLQSLNEGLGNLRANIRRLGVEIAKPFRTPRQNALAFAGLARGRSISSEGFKVEGNKVINTISTTLDGIGKAAVGDLKDLAGNFQDGLGLVGDVLGKAGAALAPAALTNAAKQFKDMLKEVQEFINNALGRKGKGGGSVRPRSTPKGRTPLTEQNFTIEQEFTGLNAFMRGLKDAGASLAQFAKDNVPAIAQSLVGSAGKASTALKVLADSGGNWIAAIAALIGTIISETEIFKRLVVISDGFIGSLGELVDGVVSLTDAIDFMDDALVLLTKGINFVAKKLNTIGDTVTSALKKVGSKIGSFFNSVLGRDSTLEQSTSKVRLELDRFATSIRGVVNAVLDDIGGLGKSMAALVAQFITTGSIGQNAEQLSGFINDLTPEQREKFAEAARDKVEGLEVQLAAARNFGGTAEEIALLEFAVDQINAALLEAGVSISDTVDKMNEKTLNAPEGFKVALAKFRATEAAGALPDIGASHGILGGKEARQGGGATFTGDIHINGATDLQSLTNEIEREGQRRIIKNNGAFGVFANNPQLALQGA